MTATPIADGGWTYERNLGAGGFGVVQLWAHKQSRRKLAIKKYRWDKCELKGEQEERWMHEVRIMKSFQHPNIVRAIDMPFTICNDDIDLPVLCMEYCSGGDLRTVLNNPENCCGMKEVEAMIAMGNICSAVEYLHSLNITHRDLKPENIVLQSEDNKILYKLIDLGYAKGLGEASMCASLVGTLNYVAPELLWRKKYSCSVDYWSLGILFYELITGVKPFLPRMPHTIIWMMHIKNKAYEEICAFEQDGKINFGTDIQEPTQISRCIRSELVDWFRVALQWDWKKRGKVCSQDGGLELVIFKSLNSIVSKKIVYVFVVPLYNIYTYEVNESTTVMDLQEWLQTDTNIPASQQVLTDYVGKLLSTTKGRLSIESDAGIKKEDSVLFVFQTGQLVSQPSLKVPTGVQKMIEQAKNVFPPDTLQDLYRTAIFFMKDEVHKFRLYIFAISIKVDLVTTRHDKFNSNIEEAIRDINTLVNDLEIRQSKHAETTSNSDIMFESIYLKVSKLRNAADQIKLKFEPLVKDSERLREAAREIDSMSSLIETYQNATKMYEELIRDNSHKPSKPTEMVKIIFDFLRVRETQMHSDGVTEVLKQTHQLENELSTLEKILDSVLAVTSVYRGELTNIISCTSKTHDSTKIFNSPLLQKDIPSTSVPIHVDVSNPPDNNTLINVSEPPLDMDEPLPSSATIDTEGDVIYDNLVMRYTMENLLIEMKKKYFAIVSLD